MRGGKGKPWIWSGWLLLGAVLTVWGLALTLSGMGARRALRHALPMEQMTAAELRPGAYVRGTVTALLSSTRDGRRYYPVTVTDALTGTAYYLVALSPGQYAALQAPRAGQEAWETDGTGALKAPCPLLAEIKRGLPYGLHEEGIRQALDLPPDAPLAGLVSDRLYLAPVTERDVKEELWKGLTLLLAGGLALTAAHRERSMV